MVCVCVFACMYAFVLWTLPEISVHSYDATKRPSVHQIFHEQCVATLRAKS